jgi:hypothetical protein
VKGLWLTTLLGAGAAGVAVWAGGHEWVHLAKQADPISGMTITGLDSPVTTAFGLVALACWGVFLVTRGWLRRVVVGAGGLAALCPVPGMWGTRHDLLHTHAGSTATSWMWVALAACLVSWAAAVVAVVRAPGWPEMGRKYDAPSTAVAPAAPLEEQSALDVWKAMDEGRDPTTDGSE